MTLHPVEYIVIVHSKLNKNSLKKTEIKSKTITKTKLNKCEIEDKCTVTDKMAGYVVMSD